MVDDLDITKRTQAAPLGPVAQGYGNAHAAADGSGGLSVADAVQLSASAKNFVKEMLEGQTVAEAWQANKNAAPDIREVQSASGSGATGDETGQPSLKAARDFMMADIAWLFDAMGTKIDHGAIADLIDAQAAADGVGVRPTASMVVAQAAQTGGVAALFVENLSVTIQRDKIVDSSVARVALTTMHESMASRFQGADRPQVVDVGGQFQPVAADALGKEPVPVTPKARPERDSDHRDPLTERGQRPEDPRHALLIIREGGRLHPEGTLKIRMDAFLPIE